MKTNHPVFVLGLYIPGIAIIKHLSALGIETIGLSYIKDVPGFKLIHAKTFHIPSPVSQQQLLVNWLINKAGEYDFKPVLFNTSDDFIQFLAYNKDSLQQHFLFPCDSVDIARELTSKLELSRYAKHIGVDLPNTYEVDNANQINISVLQYPCLIKPLYANEWRTKDMKELIGSNKVIIIENIEQMRQWQDKLLRTDAKYLIQELIPGTDDNLFYCVVYRSRQGVLLRYFCGQKIRITPIHFGSASYVKTHSVTEFIPIIDKLLSYKNYIGPAGIEFKRDSRDGSFKLIEVNARYGLWDDISIDLNTDVFTAYYEDFTDQNPLVSPPSEKVVRWLSISRDFPDFIDYIKEGQLSLTGWIKTLFPPIKLAEYFKGELPLLCYFIFAKPIRKIRKLMHV